MLREKRMTVIYKSKILLDTTKLSSADDKTGVRASSTNDAAMDRLRRAVRKIDTALAEQQGEIHKFRETISDLKSAVGEMSHGWDHYRRSVKRINVAPLRRRARRLACIMDTV